MALRRTPAQIYADLTAAGFDSAAAITMTQIALGESGGRLDALGDQSLQNATWGPSVGLYQIRTLKAETGKGTDRDILALQGNPARQAQAAYNISHGGRNFTPWTVFNTGRYAAFADTVRDALAGVVGVGGSVVGGVASGVAGGLSGVTGAALGGARNLVVTALFVGLGVALVGLGAVRTVAPLQRRAAAFAGRVAGVMR